MSSIFKLLVMFFCGRKSLCERSFTPLLCQVKKIIVLFVVCCLLFNACSPNRNKFLVYRSVSVDDPLDIGICEYNLDESKYKSLKSSWGYEYKEFDTLDEAEKNLNYIEEKELEKLRRDSNSWGKGWAFAKSIPQPINYAATVVREFLDFADCKSGLYKFLNFPLLKSGLSALVLITAVSTMWFAAGQYSEERANIQKNQKKMNYLNIRREKRQRDKDSQVEI